MDRFIHSDNIMLSRRDLFNTLQDMIHSNLNKHLSGIYRREPYKIISAGLGGGLMSSTDFEVTAPHNAVRVKPGVGTGADDSLICNRDVLDVDISAIGSGLRNVCVKHRMIRSLTGKEVMLPPKGQINTDTLHTMVMDSCEVVVKSDANAPNEIHLARIYVDNGSVPVSSTIGKLNRNLYIGDTSISMPSANLNPPAWSNEDGLGTMCVRIGDEYIIINTINNNLIMTRGAYGTRIGYHQSGSDIESVPIIDMRHLSLIGMSTDDPSISYLEHGMVEIGGSVRSIATRDIKEPMSAPVVSIASDPIIWVNRNNAMGVITPEMQDAYNSLSVSQVNIDNMQAELNDISYRIVGASDDEAVQLHGEQKRINANIVELMNERRAKILVLSNTQAIQSIQSVSNKFMLSVDVENTSPGTPVQYEAEVIRLPVSGTAKVSSDTPEYHYSKRLNPIGYSTNGDPVYTSDRDQAEQEIRIPIDIGEKLRIRVRAIDSNGVAGKQSAAATYSFKAYSDRQYNTYNEIYRMIVPMFSDMMQTMDNYIGYIKNANERIRSMENQVEQQQQKVSYLQNSISMLELRIGVLEPLIPLVPIVGDLQSKAMSIEPPTTTTGTER